MMIDEQGSNLPVSDETLELAVQVVSAYVGNNSVDAYQLTELISSVYATLLGLGRGVSVSRSSQRPAVPIKKSVTPEYIICLEDGKKLKMLKRHLRAVYGMSPDDYRAKWGLPPSYPMVAPNYAEQRSAFAKQIGLGRLPVKGAGRKKSSRK